MPEKIIQTRIVNKHATEEAWDASDFIPKQGEFIIYDIDDIYNYERLKIGDGVNYAYDLPFISSSAAYRQDTVVVDGITWNRTMWSGGKYEAHCTITLPADADNFTVKFPNELIDPFVRYDIIRGGLSFDTECTTTSETFSMSYDCGTMRELNLTVMSNGVNYFILEGTEFKRMGVTQDLTLTSNADASSFVEVRVNGEAIDKSNYTVKAGSTKITLKESYLRTLPSELHTIEIVSTDGLASCTLDLFTSGLIGPDGTITSWEQLIADGFINVTAANIVAVNEDKRAMLLGALYLPYEIKTIENRAFYGCKGLTKIVIPGEVTAIGTCVFGACVSLTSIIVAGTNTSYHSLNNCLIETGSKKLIAGCKTSVIPADGSVISIGGDAFLNCSSLKAITLPGCITNIESQAFWGCSSLTYIGIPASVTKIDTNAFWGCTGLAEIRIGNGVTEIGGAIFTNCSSLTKIYLPQKPPKLTGGLGITKTNVTLYVPTADSKSAYEIATNWSSYKGSYVVA